MEEILQSIKRIIAEENDGAEEAVSTGSGEVLELTDLIDDSEPFDHAIETAPAAPAAKPAAAEAPKPAVPAPPAAPKETDLGSSTLVAMPIEPPAMEDRKDVLKDIDSLLSDETRKASSAMMKSLSESKKPTPSPVISAVPSLEFRSGHTVEDLVMEALKPMLKEWLDTNLLQIVEKLVQKEIDKINA